MSEAVGRRAFVAAVAVTALLPARAALASAGGDEGVLQAAVGVERTAVMAYACRARGPGRNQARAPPAADARNILARPTTQRGFARLAIALELQAVAAYHEAQFTLSDPDLRLLSARIMANQGQHLAVLRQLAGEPPVPHAFERGVA